MPARSLINQAASSLKTVRTSLSRTRSSRPIPALLRIVQASFFLSAAISSALSIIRAPSLAQRQTWRMAVRRGWDRSGQTAAPRARWCQTTIARSATQAYRVAIQPTNGANLRRSLLVISARSKDSQQSCRRYRWVSCQIRRLALDGFSLRLSCLIKCSSAARRQQRRTSPLLSLSK